MPFSQGVALGYLILPLQGKCRHTVQISRALSLTASSTSSLTVAKEPRSLSLSKGPGSFVRNERRIWKPTLNGISCLTSLKCKRRNNVLIVNMYLKNLCLRFKLVKICNKKLCAPPQERTVAHASGSERIVLIPCFPVAILLLPLILPSVVNLLPFTHLHLKPNLFELNLVLC